MGQPFLQLLLLVKKNFILQRRRPIGAIIELIIPCLSMALVVWIVTSIPSDDQQPDPHCFETSGPVIFSQDSYSKLIMLAPAGPGTTIDKIADLMIKRTGYIPNSYRKIFITEESDFINYINSTSRSKAIILLPSIELSRRLIKLNTSEFYYNIYTALDFSLEFHNFTDDLFSYSLRDSLGEYSSYETKRNYKSPKERGQGDTESYYIRSHKFLGIQQMVDESIMQHWDIKNIPVMNLRQGPVPPYIRSPSNQINAIITNVVCQMIVVSFLWIGASISKELVGDKCSRMKETMKMMGLSNWILWSSWVISRCILMFITVLIMILFLKIGKVFPKSDPLLLFIFFFLYAVSVMCFCFFLSTLFSKATTAVAGTLICYFLIFVPFYFLGTLYDNNSLGDGQLSAACLLSSTCMGLGVKIIWNWETSGGGLGWSEIPINPTQVSDDQHFNFGYVLMMLMIDILLYSILTWYVEAVFPGEYGIALKPWFMFTRKYWMGKRSKSGVLDSSDEMGMNDLNFDETAHEKVPKSQVPGIVIKGLRKTFKTHNGKIIAVDNLSLNMYEDQVTSLLGHNGAGKTTVMSMLTGLYSPSSGYAVINNQSILTDMDSIRDSLGICPQHNILFDSLTVMEHLDFFIRLKGLSGPGVAQEAQRMVEMLKLTDVKNTRGAQLSGGMKRKLSVGIALAGGSKIIILDEPTSGMDPYARRATWDLILQNKIGRTILLTTHYMDEADLLGDRVAIMAAGRLVCSGSSMFLKKKYGVGYHLSMVKSPQCEPERIDKIIKSHVTSSTQSSNIGSELVYVMSSDNTSDFIPLLKTLEEQGEELGVQSFGLSLTTMEEVFINVGELVTSDGEKNAHIEAGTMQFKLYKEEELNSGLTLAIQQFKAMIMKRFINSKRNKKAIFTQIILPLIFTVLGLLIVVTIPNVVNKAMDKSEPARDISLKAYPGGNGRGNVYFGDFEKEHTVLQDIKSYVVKELGYNAPINRTDETLEIKANLSLSESDGQCCKNPSLQLNEKCSERGREEENWLDCENKTSWGYNNCYRACFSSSSSRAYCTTSPIIFPDSRDVGDDTCYFVNDILSIAQGDTEFWSQHQAAFVLSKVPRTYELTYNGAKVGYKQGQKDARWTLRTTSNTSNTQYMITGWYSVDGIHVSPGVQNALSNLILSSHNKHIQTINHPIHAPANNDNDYDAGDMMVLVFALTLTVLMVIGFSLLSSSFSLFIVEERQNKSKHLQEISGVNGAVYWLGTFTWDMINYLIICLIVLIIFFIFSVGEKLFYSSNVYLTLGPGEAFNLLFVLLLYGWSSITFIYLASLIFPSPVTAYAIITVITVIAGITCYVIGFIKSDVRDYFLFLPHNCFANSISSLFIINYNAGKEKTCLIDHSMEYCKKTYGNGNGTYSLEDGKIGKETLSMFVFGVLYLFIVIIQELYWKQIGLFLGRNISSIISQVAPKDIDEIGEDDDVITERRRIDVNLCDVVNNDAVVLHNIRKLYGNKVAVENLSIGIPYKECFGLLGVNGAGKTTTFSMLTGELSMSGGEAFLCGYNIQQNLRQIQQRVGYCPQFDALIGVMTGRELLSMFADLRGIPSSESSETVNEAIRNLNLQDHADKLCGTYSGGNKRKLSTAIALVGNPPVVFLDEPTAGMDPAARRFLWNVLCALTANGTSIILTTHSMEECEALCNRLVIMVNGAFRCLGSLQHLKNKYGQGYSITLTHKEESAQDCFEFIIQSFPGASCKEQHTGYMHFECNDNIKWSFVFEMLEKNRERLGIEDYAVNQTTLEQVFLNFAKEQSVEESPSRGCCDRLCCRKSRQTDTAVVPVMVENINIDDRATPFPSSQAGSVQRSSVRRLSRQLSVSKDGYVRQL